ncbi:MAG: hypothetical protein PHR96_04370 [Clostridia bacterium]|nr:hypothetical protein [Clostridia bacterium]
MKVEIQNVIKLDDNNEYVVVGKADYEKEIYLYIVDINDNSKFKITKLDKDKLIEIENNKELIRKLIILFYESAIKTIDLNSLVRNQLKKQ